MNKQFYNTTINTTGGSCCCCCCICNIYLLYHLYQCVLQHSSLYYQVVVFYLFLLFLIIISALAHISGFFFVHFSDGYDHFFLWLVSRVFLVWVLARKISGVQSIILVSKIKTYHCGIIKDIVFLHQKIKRIIMEICYFPARGA